MADTVFQIETNKKKQQQINYELILNTFCFQFKLKIISSRLLCETLKFIVPTLFFEIVKMPFPLKIFSLHPKNIAFSRKLTRIYP